MDDKSPKSGYSYEYLQKLASYTGWKYEYVYGEWDELFDKLKDGEIDLMAGVAYSEDRVDRIGYPDSEMLNETFYIYKDTDDTSMQCGDIDSYNGKKIGTLKDNQRMTTTLEQWKARHRANIEIEYYSDLTECARAFNEQQIDGFVHPDWWCHFPADHTIIQKPCEKENFGNYEIHVRDNGCGMSEEFLQKIFEPFERQANSTISGIQGTGLGMTIIKGFVDAMGGTIDIISEENKGTEIIVRLCQRIAEAPKESEEQKKISCSPEAFAGKRVLLVEDNDMNREIATAILEETGFKVDTAENGAIAVEKVTYYPEGFYDVILMDIQMPVMDGYTATRKIRSLENKAIAKIPIVAISANAFDEDREASLAAGMNGHLAKPIVVEELLEMLGGII